MSNRVHSKRTRILFFGTPGVFSRSLLQSLNRPDVEIVGIVHRSAFAGSANIRRISPRTRVRVPGSFGLSSVLDQLPHFLVRNLRTDDERETLSALNPHLIVVGCFPLRLPAPIRNLASIAAINVHPSLLPRHRGPDPIFWAFRNGDTEIGVSLHLIEEEFDTGALITQDRIDLLVGTTFAEVETILAQVGSTLLGRVIEALPLLESVPQPTDRSSYESFAGESDLTIDPTWTVDHARRFIEGVGESHGPLSYRRPDSMKVSFRRLAGSAEGVEISLRDGVLRVAQLQFRPLTVDSQF